MNSFPLRQCRHDRSSSCFTRFVISLGLAATVCGCHYCPYNRHVLKPGQDCASDYFGNAYAWHPGHRRNAIGCDSFGNRHYGGCTDEQLDAYNPTPDPTDASETPTEATPMQPVEVAPEIPGEVAIEEPAADPSLLKPFAPVENFPPPPTESVDPPAAAERLSPAPEPAVIERVTPLFERGVELNEIDVAPEPLPEEAPATIEQRPTPAIPTQPDVRSIEEEQDGDSAIRSLFRLEFPPRLFRMRDDEESSAPSTTEEPAPPVSEASGVRGSRSRFGHSLLSR